MLSRDKFVQEKTIVIADDLTGANEVAAVMARCGKKCLVLHGHLTSVRIEKLWASSDGLVFDLDSRRLSPEKAYDKIRSFLNSSEEIRKRLIYKKIDSTLRGNVGKEIDAVLDTGWRDLVVLVPAFPRMRRLTIGGHHLVDGLPLDRTSYVDNFTQSSVPKLLRTQSNYRTHHVSLDTIRLGPHAVSKKLLRTYEKGAGIAVCDCCNNEDLKSIKQAILDFRIRVLPVGSAGLFEELFHQYEPPRLPCLVVCGSLNQTTRSQLARLVNQKESGYLELRLSSLLSGDNQSELKRLRLEGKAMLAQGKNLIIATPKASQKIRKGGVETVESKIRCALASLAKYFIQGFPLAGVIATGGDTVASLLDELRGERIEVIGEVEPFVPIGVLRDVKGKDVPLVTKTGGFGTEDVFLRTVDYLTKRRKKIEN